ncbi:hypothetical protein VTJ04DRAFT_6183 [Mycothermus thermophilus]|uniref:uncharacterized protein n=1 Tax=Humicola insolens TaxID=85995 RepID=UPI003741F3CA
MLGNPTYPDLVTTLGWEVGGTVMWQLCEWRGRHGGILSSYLMGWSWSRYTCSVGRVGFKRGSRASPHPDTPFDSPWNGRNTAPQPPASLQSQTSTTSHGTKNLPEYL